MSIHFSMSDAKASCKKDAPSANTNIDEFVKDNAPQVYYAVNTWMGVMVDCGVPLGVTLSIRKCITTMGLIPVVEACSSISDMLLEGLAIDQLPDEHQWEAELAAGGALRRFIGVALDFITAQPTRTAEEKCANCVQFLLFLERFTYIGGSDQEFASMSKFLAANSKCREMEYHWDLWPGDAVIGMMRQALSEIYTVRDWSYDTTDCGFSTGSVLEASATSLQGVGSTSRLAKYYWLSKYTPMLFRDLRYPLPGGNFGPRRFFTPEMRLVPKKFDVSRAIFPEDTEMSYYAHGTLKALRRMLDRNGSAKFINEDDQSVNREFARSGSQTGLWATIDMSSASDTISKALAFAVFPRWYHPILENTCSRYFKYTHLNKTRERKLFTLYTSGNPMTWLTESTWFLAAGRVAASLCGFEHPEFCVFVYGDDMIVRVEAFDATVELLECLGHTVNKRKSYGSGIFRESCGGWYVQGENITPVYWPRAEVSAELTDSLLSLIELQHKFFASGLTTAEEVARALIARLEPKVTRSTPFSVYSDIWDPSCDPYSDDAAPDRKSVV